MKWPHQSSRCPECGIKQGDLGEQPCRLSTRIAELEVGLWPTTPKHIADLEAQVMALVSLHEPDCNLRGEYPEEGCSCTRIAELLAALEKAEALSAEMTESGQQATFGLRLYDITHAAIEATP